MPVLHDDETANGEIERSMIECIAMAREFDPNPSMAHGLKLGEECGEVQEAVLVRNGFCSHKELKEGVIEEVADVINTCMALLAATYDDADVGELARMLAAAMEKKNEKYANTIGVYDD